MSLTDLRKNVHPSLSPQIRMFCGLLISVIATSLAHPQDTPKPSAEEIQIRTAYARLSIGTEVATIRNLALENATPSAVADSLAKNVVHFKINSIKIGDIAEILNDTYGNLVTFPETTSLETGYSGHNNSASGIETSEGGAYARWATVEPPTFSTSLPLSTVLQTVHLQGIKRYAKVTVTASLDGQERSYNGLWLFLDNARPPVIIDPSSGAALMTISSHSVYPHVLLETGLRFNGVVQGWLASKTVDNQACTTNQQSECCDIGVMQCGISLKDIQQSLRKATDSKRVNTAHPLNLDGTPLASGSSVLSEETR